MGLTGQESKDVEGNAQATFTGCTNIFGLSRHHKLCLKGLKHFKGIVTTGGETVKRTAILLEIEIHGNIDPHHALDARIDLRHGIEVLIDAIDNGESQPFEKGTMEEFAGRGVCHALLIEHAEHCLVGCQNLCLIVIGKGLLQSIWTILAAL